MRKIITSIILLMLAIFEFSLSSCTSTYNNVNNSKDNLTNAKHNTVQLPKLLALLSSKQKLITPVMEVNTTEGFIVWDCKDSINEEDVLFQIGYFTPSTHTDQVIGFIIRNKPFLQDILWTEGTPIPGELISPDKITSEQILSPSGIAPSGEHALFSKHGLDYQWDWGDSEIGEHYILVLKPNGTLLYYDFTNISEGQSISPTGIYKAIKRF